MRERIVKNRPLSKSNISEEFKGAYGPKSPSVYEIHENSMTGVTQKLPERCRLRLRSVKDSYNIAKVAFIQRSLFYRFSLDKRSGIFSTEKFITDPWSGNATIGKSILDGRLSIEGSNSKTDILSVLSNSVESTVPEIQYVNSFTWIRDLQAMGGNNSRKYARRAISTFIDSYKSTKHFWIKSPSWHPAVIGERIVNWMLSYSFFASGSTDKFQREVLSSIAEQFSHLTKVYKAELNPYSRMLALKAIFFCLCSMKSNQARHIRKTLKDICETVCINFDEYVMFVTRNPVDHFNMFRSLLEVRFMAKSSDINLPEDVFYKDLSKMAACVRFLRLGDGCISSHSGDRRSESYIVPNQHIVDTALSLVDIQHYNEKSNKVPGFERLSTKKTTIIINTNVRNIKSRFNSPKEPGVNIFDFEASFGLNRLINRSDVSVLLNGFRIKADSKSNCFFKKDVVKNELYFDGEIQQIDGMFNFALRRKIFININKAIIRGTDYAYVIGPCETSFRFALNKACDIESVNSKQTLITLNKKEFLLQINESSGETKTIIQDLNYPSIEIIVKSETAKEAMCDWSIEELEK